MKSTLLVGSFVVSRIFQSKKNGAFFGVFSCVGGSTEMLEIDLKTFDDLKGFVGHEILAEFACPAAAPVAVVDYNGNAKTFSSFVPVRLNRYEKVLDTPTAAAK